MAAPTLKSKYAVSVDVGTLKVTDITGEYSATNTGGWGAPNWDLNETALWVVVKRQASAGEQLFVPKTVDIVYDAGALNTDETEIEFDYYNDGVIDVTIGALQVSTDGVNYVAGGAIPNDDFFYWNNGGTQIWQMVAGVPTAVADAETLVDNPDAVQVTVTDILTPRLAVEKQSLYKQYRKSRDTKCDDAQELFDELQKLSQDIQGAIYAFYSGLTVEAQSQVETMLDRYELTDPA